MGGKPSKTVQDYLLKYGLKNKGQIIPLKKPAGAKLRIADVDDTIYRHDKDEVYAWENFFLPDPVHMQVFAVVEDVSCLGEQPVLMTCENKRVYAYDDDVLHLVALSLKELLTEGLTCPADEKYYKGDAFKDMTEEDWAKEMQSPLGKKLDEEHRELVKSYEPRILEILRSTRSKQSTDWTDERSFILSSESRYMSSEGSCILSSESRYMSSEGSCILSSESRYMSSEGSFMLRDEQGLMKSPGQQELVTPPCFEVR